MEAAEKEQIPRAARAALWTFFSVLSILYELTIYSLIIPSLFYFITGIGVFDDELSLLSTDELGTEGGLETASGPVYSCLSDTSSNHMGRPELHKLLLHLM